ncbi:hypothetical protein Tco_0886974 [Tanacetum coccineum]
MSSPNRSTFDIEDAFSSMNILNYTSVSSDYFSASPGSNSFNSSENSTDNIIPPVFSSIYNNPCLKDVQAFYAKELTYSLTDPITVQPILTPSLLRCILGKSSIKMHLKHHEEQIEDIFNYLDELSFHYIEKMEEGRTNGNELKTELKRIRTQIIKLQKKQLGSESTSCIQLASVKYSANKNTGPTRTFVAKTINYKEFVSCQPFYFNGTEGAVDLIHWFEQTESVFSRSNCAEENKVTFATGTLTDNSLSWWNSYAQPIGIDQANRIT